MSNKYYIPTIEEFHIGFRYEWLDENNKWIKETSPEEITKEGFAEQLYGLRVKRLDQQDLEELNWKYISSTKREIFFTSLKNTNFNIVYNKNLKKYLIRWGENTHFRGKIKNYNELKTIMDQIGI